MEPVNPIDVLDPLDYPEEVPSSLFEYQEYKHPFELWDTEEYLEPDGIYQPIHGAIEATPERQLVMVAIRENYSRELILACKDYIQFYQSHPKPIKPDTDKGSEEEKAEYQKAWGLWQAEFKDFYNTKKASLTALGWPGRMVNTILEQAEAKLSSSHKCAERHLAIALKHYESDPSNYTHTKIQYWEGRQDYEHFCLGDKRVLVEMQNIDAKIDHIQAAKPTLQTAKQLTNLAELKQLALDKWHESRKFPVICVGSGGKDGGKWMNKTVFLRQKPKYPGEYEFVLKYPKFLKPGHQGKTLPMLIFPVKLSARALTFWKLALSKRKCLTFTLMPQAGNRWRVTGVFKEEKVAKFALKKANRIGIDQNAGFIAVALIHGPKLRWVKKYRISQKGSSGAHEARLYEVMRIICELARVEQAVIVIEDLRLVDKHKEATSKKVRRHIQRIPYRKLQEILGRVCSRAGATLRQVNPAYTSILGRYRLPGMQVHLAAAAMIAWRDMGCASMKLFQIGSNCLKIQGEDSPIIVEILEGMPMVLSNREDPRFLAALYKHLKGEIAKRPDDCQAGEKDGKNRIRSTTVLHPSHGSETQVTGFEPRTSHDQRCPAAGIGPS